ncbi:hypothetical protein [Marinobacter metalliresistant]|uniref:Lipoprotein n=1 Tax=Marinobacter metalliresistant TaxID=2961995 RepID=A0ABZ2VXF3_9GAMM
MKDNRQPLSLTRWQGIALIALQLLFAACATSVLVYRAQGWAPETINFGLLSYRAFNIYISLGLVIYFIWGIVRKNRYVVPLLSLFALFHMVEGMIIGFWVKSALQLATLVILARIVYASRS